MNHAFFVRFFRVRARFHFASRFSSSFISDLDTQIEHRFDAHRLPCDLMLQRQAVQKFHDDEWLPIVVIAL